MGRGARGPRGSSSPSALLLPHEELPRALRDAAAHMWVSPSVVPEIIRRAEEERK